MGLADLMGVWWCGNFHAPYFDATLLRGTLEHGVRVIHCKKCNKRYIISDEHRSVFRYDHDECMIRDLCSLYNVSRKTLMWGED